MSGDIFLKLDGIEGESADSKHKGEMQLETFSWGESNATSFTHGTGGGVGKVHMQDIHFTKVIDKGSPNLMLACASGKHIASGMITFRKAGEEQQEFLKIKLTDVMVASITLQDHSAGATLPHESVALSFGKIEMEYKPQKKDGQLDGAVPFGWDIKENKKV
jgi:type VI secretion system secreted protein Hcp